MKWKSTGRRLRRPASLVAAIHLTACLPTGPSDAERVVFMLDFEQPYRVPMGAAVTPRIKIAVRDKVLENPSYRLEAAGIVRVDSTGRGLHGLARGTTSVRLVYPTATGAPDTTFSVQVVVSRVALDPPQYTFTRLGDTTRLVPTAMDANEAVVPNTPFTWSSTDSLVARVLQGTGIVRAVDEGTATIISEVDGVEGRTAVTVTQVASSLRVAPEVDTLRSVKSFVEFVALAFDSTGRIIRTAKPRWTSSDPAVATVDATGRARATGPGTGRVVARVGGAADTATLVVMLSVKFLFVSPPLDTLTAIDDTARVTAIATDSSHFEIPNPRVTWASSDPTIAMVDPTGLVTALRNGAAVVTAASGGQSAFATIVVRQEPATVRLAEDRTALTGYHDTLRLHVQTWDRNGFAVTVDATALAWRSLLDLVATVDSGGLVTAEGDGTTAIVVSVADSAGAASDTATVTVTGAPTFWIAFNSPQGIEVIRRDGLGRTVLLKNNRDDTQRYFLTEPAWSPDGTRLAVTVTDGFDCGNYNDCSEVWTVHADGSRFTRLTFSPGLAGAWSATWSPDGTKIAFVSDREAPGATSGIYVTDASASDGSDRATKLASGGDPAWSPDGTKLAYSDVGDIYVIHADGTGAVKLTASTEGDVQPTWSPDGVRLAFARWPYDDDPFGNSDIWVMNADGSGARNLIMSDGGRCDWAPAWSADGLRIAFVGGPPGLGGPANIYVMNADGTGGQQLTASVGTDRNLNPAWGGVGGAIGLLAHASAGKSVGDPMLTVGGPRAPTSHESSCFGWVW